MITHDQRHRLQNTVRNALEGCQYESSEAQDGKLFVLNARRASGRRVQVVFRGVQSATAEPEPSSGGEIHVSGVGAKFSIWSLFLRTTHPVSLGPWHVRINAGEGRIEVVCQDAEWFEEDRAGS